MRNASYLEHEAILDVSDRIIEILQQEGKPMDAFNILAVTVARIELHQGSKDKHMENMRMFLNCIMGNIKAFSHDD